MAVRTKQAGVRHKRLVDPHDAQPSQAANGGRRKRLPRDAAAAARRASTSGHMKLGPAAKPTDYERGRIPPTVTGRKKAPSQMKVKRRGGPFKSTRLHGG